VAVRDELAVVLDAPRDVLPVVVERLDLVRGRALEEQRQVEDVHLPRDVVDASHDGHSRAT
jgi:hypothetical protein